MSIKNKITIALLIYALLSMGTIGALIKANNAKKKEINRLGNNQEILMSDIEKYKTKSGADAAKIGELTMTVDEFKRLNSEQMAELKDMKLKIKYLNSISSTGTNTNVVANTVLRDTVFQYVVDSILVKENAKYFKWNDEWNSIEGKINGDNVECTYNGVDTLTVAAVRIPKKFLFFRWGTKRVEVNIKNHNPSSTITYNKSVAIKR